MSRGRKPTAPHLKVIQGTERPDRQQEEAIDFGPLDHFPPAPQHLDADGAAMWNDLGPKLMQAGVMQSVDLYPLQQLCYCWSRHVKKQKAGMDITAAEDTALKSLFSEFGMSYNARRKGTNGEPKAGNKFAGIGQRA